MSEYIWLPTCKFLKEEQGRVLNCMSLYPVEIRAVYRLDFFNTDTNFDTDTLIMIPIRNDTNTVTFTTKCQHIL